MISKELIPFFVCISTFKVFGDVDVNLCCPPEQNVLIRETDHYCWEPTTNETSFISLRCKEEVEMGLVEFEIRDRQLVFLLPNAEFVYDESSFCVANFITLKDKNLTLTNIAIVCPDSKVKVIPKEVFGFCMVVSAILLLLTAAIYTALPELWDLQGKSVINFCISLGIGLGIFASMDLLQYQDMKLCAARGFLSYFFIVASFFWTNAISIQILRSLRRPTASDYGWREFFYYAAYAWGVPIVLTVAMAIVNFIPGDHLKPGIGLHHCWFFNNKQQWQYMYSVITILILANITIFLYTSFVLCRCAFSSSHVNTLKFEFFMTVRLFIVMGVPWIFEMVTSLTSSHIVWDILDTLNSLQGVYVFLVLVVFRRNVAKLMLRNGWCLCLSSPVERCLSREEDEEDVVHTVAVPMEDQNNKQMIIK